MTQSTLRTITRSFLSGLFAVLGLIFGLVILIMLLGILLNESSDTIKIKSFYTPTITANANDVRKELSEKAPVILRVPISGVIGTPKLNMQTVRQLLTESREGLFKNNRVKALLVEIRSPGGTVVDSDGIYHALREYKEKYNVPVYCYVDGLCASGGMYIASACDKICASNTSLIGSVGVLSPPFFNVVGLMDKVGIFAKTLSMGKGKDELNPFRAWKEGESDSYQAIIDYYYNQFVDIVLKSRPNIKRTRLINDYGAHIFPAEKAKEFGYIDESGYSYDQTLKLLAKEIGIEDQFYQVVTMERKFEFSDLFSNGSMMLGGKVKHQIDLPQEFDPNLLNKFLYLYLP